jgi:hypothetical protein
MIVVLLLYGGEWLELWSKGVARLTGAVFWKLRILASVV